MGKVSYLFESGNKRSRTTSCSVATDDSKISAKREMQNYVSFHQLFRFTNAFDKIIIALMILSSIGIGVAYPLNVLIFKDVVDIIVSPVRLESYSKTLYPQIIYFAILASATFACGFIQMVCVSVTGERQNRRYKNKFYTAILRQDISWFDMNQTGQLMTKMTDDIESIEIAVADKLAQFVQQMSSFVGSVIVALTCGWKLSLVGCISIPVMVLTFCVMVNFIKKYSIAQVRAYSVAGGIAEEILSAIRTVVAFNAEEKEVERYTKNLQLAEKYGIKKSIFIGLGNGITGFIVFAMGSLVFYLGFIFVRDGTYTPGMVILIFLTVVMGSIALGSATPMLENFMVAQAAAYHIFDVIDRKPFIDTEKRGIIPESFDGDIHFDHVYFEYPSRPGVQILTDFTFTIPNGKTVAFVGPSGSGKSTIINLIQRFYDPISGTISLADTNLKFIDLKWYRSYIGVVQQEPPLFTGTVEENIRMGKKDATYNDIEKASKSSHAYEFIMETKDQFKTELGDLGMGFSGGQKQRIAIATALIREPHLLLLDEATSALDNRSEKIVQSALEDAILSRKITVVIVAHRLQTVKKADIIVVMQNGKIVEQGSHTDLKEFRGLYSEMLHGQKSRDMVEEEVLLDIHPNFTRASSHDVGRRRLSSICLPEGFVVYEGLSKFQVVRDFIRVLKLNQPEACFLIVGIIAATFVGATFPCTSLIYSEMFKIFTYQNEPEVMVEQGQLFCILMLVPAFGLLVSQFLKNTCLGKAGEALTTRIRSNLMEAILRQEMAWFDMPENIPGILTGRLASEASLVKGTAGIQLSIFVESVANICLSLMIGFYFSWALTLVFFIFIPFIILSGIMQGKLSSNQKLSAKDSIESNSLIMESLNNIRIVNSLSLQSHFSSKFVNSLKTNKRKDVLNLFVFGLFSAFGISSIYYAYCVVFFVGLKLIDKRSIEMIHLMRVFSCLTMSSAALGRALAMTPDAEKARLATRRTFETVDRETKIDSHRKRGIKPRKLLTGNIEFRNVYFRYPTRLNVPVLQGLNLTIKAGETLALVGNSGCGKSTLIQLLERYYDIIQPTNKTTGQILMDNFDLKSLNLAWVRSQFGLVKQEPSLFNITILENIAYGSETAPQMEVVESVAKMANIHDFIVNLPEGYYTKVGQRGSHLSGGQKQRICIARALYNKPSILLLDEATSALDTESEKVVQEALDQIQKSCTSIVIAHRLSTIQNADKIVVFENGSVVESGTHDELMAKRKRYYDLNMQHKD